MSASEIYFQENFQNYTENAPLCPPSSKGFTVSNEPIWAADANMDVRAKEAGPLFTRNVPDQPLSAVACDSMFRSWLLNEEGGFDAELLGGNNAQETVLLKGSGEGIAVV